MKKALVCIVASVVCVVLGWPALAYGLQYTFVTVDYNPTINSITYDRTLLTGINDNGDILGVSSFANTQHVTFLTDVGVSGFTQVPPPPWGPNESGFGLNDAVDIVGGYMPAFQLSGGTYTEIAVPGSYGTSASDINDSGHIAGSFNPLDFERDPTVGKGASHGYLFNGTTFTPLFVPGADQTVGLGLNDNDDVVGEYINAAFDIRAFLHTGGAYHDISVAGAGRVEAYGINGAGDIAGVVDSNNIWTGYGFLYQGGGFYKVEAPGSLATWPRGIDNFGRIAGGYSVREPDDSLTLHGFIAFPAAVGQGVPLAPLDGSIEEIPPVVPEPASLGLIGLALLAARRRWK